MTADEKRVWSGMGESNKDPNNRSESDIRKLSWWRPVLLLAVIVGVLVLGKVFSASSTPNYSPR